MASIPQYTLDELRARRPLRTLASDEPGPPALGQRLLDLFGAAVSPAEAVARMIADVRAHGDAAVRDWSRRLDGWAAAPEEPLLMPDFATIEAYDRVPDATVRALERAAERIDQFHRRQPATGWLVEEMGGWRGQFVRPLERVAIYVPAAGPRLAHLLAAAIPARVAGVDEVMVCTPPAAGGDLAPALLVAADIAGIDAVYRAGHASGVAACAFGTESIPPADKIVGSGDLFIRLALQQLHGATGVVDPGGAAGVVVVADEHAGVEQLVSGLMAHLACTARGSVLLMCVHAIAAGVQAAVAGHPEAAVRAEALAARAGLVVVDDIARALALAEELAPARLILDVQDAWEAARQVRHAGAICLGVGALALGDWMPGPSGFLPAGGAARFASPLSVWDFVRLTNFAAMEADEAAEWETVAELVAQVEGMGNEAMR